jgi:hypothetical protein
MSKDDYRLSRWKLIFSFLGLLVRAVVEVWTRGGRL